MTPAALLAIPARRASTRLPNKPLASLAGRPLIRWTWEAARRVPGEHRVVIATDDEEIAAAARAWGAEAALTSPDCASGSDRCAEVLESLAAREGFCPKFVVNVQGDEPFLDPAVVTACLRRLEEQPGLGVSTPVFPMVDEELFLSPHAVKALPRADGQALLFSRAPIPCGARTSPEETAALWRPWLEEAGVAAPPRLFGFKHLGLYAFRVEALRRFVTLAPSRLERLEKLEQLRLLENGVDIGLVPTGRDAIGIDTPDDLKRAEPFARALLAEREGKSAQS